MAEILDNKKIEISSNRNYWLVRTMSGDYYNEYSNENYIAIGYNEITLKDLKYANSFKTGAQRVLTEIIDSRYNKDRGINPSYAASQLLKFMFEIKVGDVVIVPGKSSNKQVAIGVVTNKSHEITAQELPEEQGVCPFLKRINVNWIKSDCRDKLNPQMQLMFNSRHIVSNISSYSSYIDSTTNDFYEKDNNIYIVLRVKTNQDISVSDFLFTQDIFALVNEYSAEQGEFVNAEDVVKIKVCVQSPGDIIMFAANNPALTMFVMGALIILINGGGLKIDKLGFDLSTHGILKSVSEFLDRRTDRKLQESVRKKLETLEIQNPENILDAIKDIKNPRSEY